MHLFEFNFILYFEKIFSFWSLTNCTTQCLQKVIVNAALKKAEMKCIEDVPFNMGTSVDSQVCRVLYFISPFKMSHNRGVK